MDSRDTAVHADTEIGADGPRVAEFFCGIGCMHHALVRAGIVAPRSAEGNIQGGSWGSVVRSFDINPVCGAIYEHNFCRRAEDNAGAGKDPSMGNASESTAQKVPSGSIDKSDTTISMASDPLKKSKGKTQKKKDRNARENGLSRANIASMTLKKLNQLAPGADTWVMSPPCQPYTRTGSQLHSEDSRAGPLHNLCNLLPHALPKRLFVENVVGFETSDSRTELISTLIFGEKAGSPDFNPATATYPDESEYMYRFAEFIVTPTEIGVPNERPRYYLLAWLQKPREGPSTVPKELLSKLQSEFEQNTEYHGEYLGLDGNPIEFENKSLRPNIIRRMTPWLIMDEKSKLELKNRNLFYKEHDNQISKLTVKDFLDTQYELNSITSESAVEDENIVTMTPMPSCIYGRKLMMITPDSTSTNCFTKAYGHHAWGSGSTLKIESSEDIELCKAHEELIKKRAGKDKEGVEPHVISLDPGYGVHARMFSPTEVARLLGLPVENSPINTSGSFEFPKDVTDKQKWRALGNSMSVVVVAELFKILFLAK